MEIKIKFCKWENPLVFRVGFFVWGSKEQIKESAVRNSTRPLQQVSSADSFDGSTSTA
jgi:hypothetical protein